MDKPKVRIGVIGLGIWGQMHVTAYKQCNSAEIVAVCDLNEKLAEDTSVKYMIPGYYSDMNEMLEKENLDAVSIATPDNCHAEPVIKAAEKGLHVMVEKPLATTVHECREMINAAKKNNVYLMIDWHNRWNPTFNYAWRAIRNNEIGDISYIYFRLSDTVYVPAKMLPWAGDSSVLHFLGSHSIDTICWLIKKKPKSIKCIKKEGILKRMGVDTPDLYLSIIDFEDGATAVVENSWALPQAYPSLIENKCEIIGSKGILMLDPTGHRAVAKYTEETTKGFPESSFPDLFVTPKVFDKQMGFAVESMYHFIECIHDGKIPLTSGEDGLLNTIILNAAEESAEAGKTVQIKL
ncbi:MAG TPA: Gfo/Idh/MocA family oxidoreductase [Anaerovoracaceae bacterium]|nr:Gfo/Idh/MocA family oxidoreductase [Anaerovoracaceae bacterium]